MAIWRRRFEHALHAVETPERDLALLLSLLARIERERVRLAAPDRAAAGAGHAAASSPRAGSRSCRRLVSWLDSTHNLMFAPIAYLLLRAAAAGGRDRSLARRATVPPSASGCAPSARSRRWRRWRPTPSSTPRIRFRSSSAGGPVFDGEALGHPLIPDERSVRNDVRLGGSAGPRVIIVSGSNMSGKSTLLRSVGVNVVLALAGAPVPRGAAARLAAGARRDAAHRGLAAGRPLALLRRDPAHPRRSSTSARGPVPLLFLLDEILHGTNSHDRRIGAEGIVRALVEARRHRAGHHPRPGADRAAATARLDCRQHAFRGSARERPDGLRLPHAPGRGRAQQRARADARRRT